MNTYNQLYGKTKIAERDIQTLIPEQAIIQPED